MLPKPRKDEYHSHTSMGVETNVAVGMRDGVTLYADVFRPSGGGKHPVLLTRIPYGKHIPRYHALYLDPVRAVSRGYAVVIQDVRGRHTSEGEFYPYRHEIEDGYDTVEWCAEQSWSNGDVGMFGISYHGATQWLAAVGAPPSLKAIVPHVTSDSYFDSWTYLGGVFQLCWINTWVAGMTLDNLRGTPPALADTTRQLEEWLRDPVSLSRHLPLKDLPVLKGVANYYYDWLDHPTYDNYWKALDPRTRFDKVRVPALIMGGWWDGFLRGTVRSYEGVTQRGATELARSQQHMLLGPWMHEPSPNPFAGEMHFGGAGSGDAIDMQGMMLAWFDHWLVEEDNGVSSDPPIYYFLMGENAWRRSDAWPLANVESRAYYLSSGGRANSGHGDGTLGLESPDTGNGSDHYLHNPANPVPTWGGAHLGGMAGIFHTGVRNQAAVEAREDVLVYTSAPLEQDMEVTGNVTATVWAATSAADADWNARLCDVHTDGTSYNVCDGILRASARESLETQVSTDPGQVYEYEIDLGPTAMLFKQGHRLRLQIASSNFPAYALNPGVDGPHHATSELRLAAQSVLHDRDHPSRLNLPVVTG